MSNFWPFLFLNVLVLCRRIHGAGEATFSPFDLINQVLLVWLGVLLLKWTFNHSISVMFGVHSIHFHEALFFDAFLTMVFPLSYSPYIYKDSRFYSKV
jgi:hypothetical protein